MRQALLVVLVACLAWGAVAFNGAGLSNADDFYAAVENDHEVMTPRALTRWTYELNSRHGGWMATNVAIHAAASLAVMGLLGPWPAVLFAAHPIVGDSVASIAGRSSMLMALFVMLALLSYRHRMYWATAGLALLALMAKEDAVVLAALLPLCAWIWDRRRQSIILLAAASLPALLLAPRVLRVGVRGAGVEQSLTDAGLAAPLPYAWRAASTFSAIGSHALPALFVPVGLGVEPRATWSTIGAEIAAVFVVLMAFMVYWHGRFMNDYILAMALLVVPLVAYVPVGLNDPFFEHRAYLAAVGASALLASVSLRRAALIIFLVMANYRGYVYGSPQRLWQEAVNQHPDSLRARINLGMIMWSHDDKQGAELQFKAAVPAPAAYQNLAGLYMSQGNLMKASEMLDVMEGRNDVGVKTR